MKLNFVSSKQREYWMNKLAQVDNQRIKVNLPDKDIAVYLTPRESVIVILLMLGDRAKQIAWKLKISLHTVNSHVSNIKQKLDCNTTFEVGYRLSGFEFMAAA